MKPVPFKGPDGVIALPRVVSSEDKVSAIYAYFAGMRFLSFSLLVHIIILVFAGTIVLTSMSPAPDFVAGDSKLVTPGETTAEPPKGSDLHPDEFHPAPPAISDLTLAVLSTTSAARTEFQVSSSPLTSNLASKIAEGASSAMGKGLGDKIGGLGGGKGMAGGTARFFGMKENAGAGLVGEFYDAKQTRARRPTQMDVDQFSVLISKLVKGGWKSSVLNDYYKAPKPLYTTQIFIPNMPAEEGPKAFAVEKEVQASRWFVHYRGRVTPPANGDFRFVGAGDDYLVVRVNGKLVLDHGFAKATDWQPEQYYNYGFTQVPNGFARGDRFHAVAGQYYDLDILISERPGGLVFFCLMLEDQAVTYQKDPKGNPILPVFRLADVPLPPLEQNQTLPPFQPNGPIWKSAPPSSTGSDFGKLLNRGE